MRYVTGLTGAIGVTFVFKLDPITRQISSNVHPSWQFSPFHRFRLMELNQLVHKAVQPSLLLSEWVKRGIRATGTPNEARAGARLGTRFEPGDEQLVVHTEKSRLEATKRGYKEARGSLDFTDDALRFALSVRRISQQS
jgi:hypothetical protein